MIWVEVTLPTIQMKNMNLDTLLGVKISSSVQQKKTWTTPVKVVV